jgi:hypothetical protein
MVRTTREVCQILGVRYYQIAELLRCLHIPAPRKNSRGEYQWSEADVENARAVFAARAAARQQREAINA